MIEMREESVSDKLLMASRMKSMELDNKPILAFKTTRTRLTTAPIKLV